MTVLYYDKLSKWVIRICYTLFFPLILMSVYYGWDESEVPYVPLKAQIVVTIIATSIYFSCCIFLFYLKRAKTRYATHAIVYEALYSLFFLFLFIWQSFSGLAFVSLSYAFNTALFLQIGFICIGGWYTYRYCLNAWNNGVFNTHSKRWDFEKMLYYIKKQREYDDVFPERKIKWYHELLAGVVFLILVLMIALSFHQKNGHDGSIILSVFFRNSPILKDYSNGILVFIIIETFLWFLMFPSFVMKLLEIKKIKQIEKEKNIRMIVSERKIFKNI